MNNFGRRLADKECNEFPKIVTQECNEFLCPSWVTSDWSEVTHMHLSFFFHSGSSSVNTVHLLGHVKMQDCQKNGNIL